MIAALDVRYDEDALSGQGAAVVFKWWNDAAPLTEYTAAFNGVEPYVPGQFFKRELPCLLAVLEKVIEPLDQIIVDGFVSLGDKPGLGMHLWEALGKSVSGRSKGASKGRLIISHFDRSEIRPRASSVPLVLKEARYGESSQNGDGRFDTTTTRARLVLAADR